MDTIDRFIATFRKTYNELMGEERKIDENVIRSLACAIVDLLDQRDAKLVEDVKKLTTPVEHHFHPGSDQILRAYGDVVIIEPRHSVEVARGNPDMLWKSQVDPTPRKDHYGKTTTQVLRAAGLAVTTEDGALVVRKPADIKEIKVDLVVTPEQFRKSVGLMRLEKGPYTLFEDGKPINYNFDSIDEAKIRVAGTDAAMAAADASLGVYILKDSYGTVVWERPARSA